MKTPKNVIASEARQSRYELNYVAIQSTYNLQLSNNE
ncbi:MAG: hypothetical protein ACJAVG_001012 [Rickettsiales bacterium]|jgi:hypothetical protein